MSEEFVWKAVHYATRLHAVHKDVKFLGRKPVRSVCGEWVYDNPRTMFAENRLKRGVPHCKRCEYTVTHSDSPEFKELSVRARNVCGYQIISKEDLAGITDRELLKIRGCGKKTLAELRKWSGTKDESVAKIRQDVVEQYTRYLEKRGYTVTKAGGIE